MIEIYYGRLNSIEHSFTGVISDTWDPSETGWKGSCAYAAAHKTAGKEYAYKTTVLAKGDTYGNTPKITKTITRVYSAKSNKKQNYREHIVITVSGFLSCLDSSVVTSTISLDSNVLYCKGFATGGEGTMRSPQAVQISYEDIDTETVSDKEQISSLNRNVKGHIKRNRVRTNVTSLNVTWNQLTADEAKVILRKLSGYASGETPDGLGSQYLRVGYYDPSIGEDVYRAMFCNTKSMDATYRGRFTNLSVELSEV